MQTLSLTSLSIGSSSVGLSVFVSVAGLTGGFAADGDVLTASVSNPADGVVYTYRYDFSGGGSSTGAGYTVDFTGDSLSDADTITVVLLADAAEVATRTFTVYETFAITAAGALADLNLIQNAAMTAVDVSADFAGFVQSIALQSGTLPTGLSFDGTTLSGTPTALQSAGTLVFRASNVGATADSAFQVSVVEVDATAPVVNNFEVGPIENDIAPMVMSIAEDNITGSTVYFGAYLDNATELTNPEIIAGSGVGFASVALTSGTLDADIDLGALAGGSYLVKTVVVDAQGNEGSFAPQALGAASGASTSLNSRIYTTDGADSVDPVIDAFTVGAISGGIAPTTLSATEANRAGSVFYFGAYLASGTALTDPEIIHGTGVGFANVAGDTDLTDESVDLGALDPGSYLVKPVMVDAAGNIGSFTPQALEVASSAFDPLTLFDGGTPAGFMLLAGDSKAEIYSDIAGATEANVGDFVGSWGNEAGTASALFDANSPTDFILRQDGGGQYYVETDGTNGSDHLTNGANLTLTDDMVLAVALRTTDDNFMILGGGQNTYQVGRRSTSTSIPIAQEVGAGPFAVYLDGTEITPANSTELSVVTDGSDHVLIIENLDFLQATNSNFWSGNAMRIFGSSASGVRAAADVYGIVVCRAFTDNTERQNLNTFMQGLF